MSRLTSLTAAFRLAHKNLLSPRSLSYRTAATLLKDRGEKPSSTKNSNDDDEMDRPIKFSGSPAANWNPVYSRVGTQIDDRPWFQTYVVLASTGIFLIYFCILREENDMDEMLTLDLSDHFKGEQKKMIIASQQLAKNPMRAEGTK